MSKQFTLAAIMVAALAVTGCNRSVNALNPNTRTPPQALPSVPAGDVQTTQLDPISGEAGTTPVPTDPNLNQPTTDTLDANGNPQTDGTLDTQVEVAAANPNVEPPTREALAGSWIVPSDNPECRIILAFTKWSGGYRAATRRCSSPEIGTVTAWDVKGQQVVLVDQSGNTVARLYASGAERYDGTTSSGKQISFAR